jgi:cupin domain
MRTTSVGPYAGAMAARDLTDLVRFSDEGPRVETLAETERIWSQVLCLQGNQGVGPMRDATADGLVVVLSGEVAAQVGRSRTRMKQWRTLVVPADEPLTIRNASPEPAVVLLVLAPPPAAR